MLRLAIIGNLGGDPETQYSPSGQARLRMNVATNGRAKNQQGEWEDRTEWVRVTVFGARAETLGQYLKKGQRVFVYGRLETRPWTDNKGAVKAGLEVVANDVEFMSSRQDDQQQPARQAQASNDDLEDLSF